MRLAVCQVNPDSVTREFYARRNIKTVNSSGDLFFDLVLLRTPAATREIFDKKRRNKSTATKHVQLLTSFLMAQCAAAGIPSRGMGTRACAFLLINQFPSVGVLLEISQPTVLKMVMALPTLIMARFQTILDKRDTQAIFCCKCAV